MQHDLGDDSGRCRDVFRRQAGRGALRDDAPTPSIRRSATSWWPTITSIWVRGCSTAWPSCTSAATSGAHAEGDWLVADRCSQGLSMLRFDVDRLRFRRLSWSSRWMSRRAPSPTLYDPHGNGCGGAGRRLGTSGAWRRLALREVSPLSSDLSRTSHCAPAEEAALGERFSALVEEAVIAADCRWPGAREFLEVVARAPAAPSSPPVRRRRSCCASSRAAA
jgi:hypothetical protein